MNHDLHYQVFLEIQRIIAIRNEKLPNRDLEDISQEVFARYLQRYSAASFNSAPIALLLVIVHNLYVDAYRRAASERAYREEKCYTDANRAAETPEAALIQAERRLRLKQALDAPLGQTGVSVRELVEAKLNRRFGEFAQKIGLSPYFLRRLELQTIRRLREA
ncbi:MAG: sigma-70 family RNA polymerase sigma factor [Thermoguttaceae bacterium]|nr:sigma-70 family RNA polymerase sigma factor [Thermoguttaceae bacterium]MBQ7110885.1 sigma-70 family RNA polymerase sigma factor [Thermoguttaceae bacterium]